MYLIDGKKIKKAETNNKVKIKKILKFNKNLKITKKYIHYR